MTKILRCLGCYKPLLDGDRLNLWALDPHLAPFGVPSRHTADNVIKEFDQPHLSLFCSKISRILFHIKLLINDVKTDEDKFFSLL